MTEPSHDHAGELNVQLPGRMMVMEILTVLLLREHRRRDDILVAAETILAHLDSANAEGRSVSLYERQVFDIAHETLAKLALEVRRDAPGEAAEAPKKRRRFRS